jgi:hypothetical protein
VHVAKSENEDNKVINKVKLEKLIYLKIEEKIQYKPRLIVRKNAKIKQG